MIKMFDINNLIIKFASEHGKGISNSTLSLT